MLNDLVTLTQYSRSYASWSLRQGLKPQKPAKKRVRQRIYDEPVLVALTRIWAILDAPCGKRLSPVIPEMIERLKHFGEIKLDGPTEAKLLKISAPTIDRLLKHERKKIELKGRSGTKPGSLLKHQIPIRTFADWDEDRPGFTEIDLVGHEGGDPSGDFCQTLDVTDVCSGWTETRAVKNKAQKWVFEALEDIITALPFPILGIDSDNGGEFINAHLVRFCTDQKITFTRARPGRKNDNCFVEQKNYSVVRKTVGYLRHDTEDELFVLNELYVHLRLYTNFFQPNMRLTQKIRIGSKVKKRYDIARTPFRRLLASLEISQGIKDDLQTSYNTLNPAELKRQIIKLQDKLFKVYLNKRNTARKEEPTPEPSSRYSERQ